MIKLLLIGGTGVLSSAVTEESLKRGYDVTMINRGSRPIPSAAHLFKSNNKDYSRIEQYLQGKFFDAVIDFLCYTKEDLNHSFALYHNYTRQYFFISSGAVYNLKMPAPFKEDDPKVLDIWPYSVNKWNCECLLEEMASKTSCNYTIIRPGVTYGNTRIPYGISPSYGYHWTLCARILTGKPIISWNGGRIRSSVMRVEDFAYQLVGLIGNKNAFNEVFNISGDESPSSNEILDELSSLLNKDCITIDIDPEFYAAEYPDRYGEIIGGRAYDSPLDNSKIRTIAPIERMYTLHEGIEMTIDAYKKDNFQKGIDWRFDADTDRIIKKWCKKNCIEYGQYNLKFVDYIDNARMFDKIIYWLEYNKENVVVSVGIKILKIVKGIIRYMKYIFKL